MMSTGMMYSSIGAWCAIVAAVTGVGVLLGMSITIGTAALVLAAGLVPATILRKVRGVSHHRRLQICSTLSTATLDHHASTHELGGADVGTKRRSREISDPAQTQAVLAAAYSATDQDTPRTHTEDGDPVRSTPQEPAQPPRPTACPFCGSSHITTAGAEADPSAYWRCDTCGQLWNVARLAASKRSYRRR